MLSLLLHNVIKIKWLHILRHSTRPHALTVISFDEIPFTFTESTAIYVKLQKSLIIVTNVIDNHLTTIQPIV